MAKFRLKQDIIYDFSDDKYAAVLSAFQKWVNNKEDTFIAVIPERNFRASDIEKLYTPYEIEQMEKKKQVDDELKEYLKPPEKSDAEYERIRKTISAMGSELKRKFGWEKIQIDE